MPPARLSLMLAAELTVERFDEGAVDPVQQLTFSCSPVLRDSVAHLRRTSRAPCRPAERL
jgi:hypothetical protein